MLPIRVEKESEKIRREADTSPTSKSIKSYQYSINVIALMVSGPRIYKSVYFIRHKDKAVKSHRIQ